MMTETEQETVTEQEIHARVYDITPAELEKIKALANLQKAYKAELPSGGGEICGVCMVKGCRIGPMLRG